MVAVVFSEQWPQWMGERVDGGDGGVLPFLGQLEPPGAGTHYTPPSAAPLGGWGGARSRTRI